MKRALTIAVWALALLVVFLFGVFVGAGRVTFYEVEGMNHGGVNWVAMSVRL